MKNREEKINELLDYLHGCAQDPAALEAELERDAELRALLDEARGTQELLSAAARGEAPDLPLVQPPVTTEVAGTDGRGPVRPERRWGWRLVAAAVILLLVGVPAARWGLAQLRVQDLELTSWRFVVSAPTHVPDGAPAHVRAQVWDVNGEPCPAEIRWSVRDVASGEEVDRGQAETDGALDVAVSAALDAPRQVELVALHAGVERTATLELTADRGNPLVHLSSDKPAYRPGETMWLRAAVLNRLSLEPREGQHRLRIVDPKGAPVQSFLQPLESGVASVQWAVPAESAGGEYVFELRDATDAFTVERLPLLVRHYQPPRLAHTIDLDRETYAPGERGAAEVRVVRVEGGVPVDAPISGVLVLDGQEVWREEARLDAQGRAIFRFTVPDEVERGEARFVARTVDGGVVETALEPFVVPTGELEVAFYPEGGDLVQGVHQRVYAEVTDPLGRPTSARGRIVDGDGRTVVSFATEHQGRARFGLAPVEGEAYRLVFDEPEAAPVSLPGVVARGVVLRAQDDVTSPGADLALTVTTPSEGPWIGGVFCRGVLVAQDAFAGAGEHALSFTLPAEVAGVLRVTVFDGALQPVAERLVQRASGRTIEITVEPDEDVLLPGSHQGLLVSTRDEAGRPVSCVLGVSVFDRAVADMTGEHRVGLADQTWLVADVEELEDVEEFVLGTQDAPRNVDLLLGTRGWRRFAWFDAEAVIAENGDEAKRLLLREGRPQVPAVQDVSGDGAFLLSTAQRNVRRLKTQTERFALVALGLGLALFVVRLLLAARIPRRPLVALSAAAVVFVVAVLGSVLWMQSRFGVSAEAMPVAAFANRVEPIGGQVEDLRLLGYAGGAGGGGEVPVLADGNKPAFFLGRGARREAFGVQAGRENLVMLGAQLEPLAEPAPEVQLIVANGLAPALRGPASPGPAGPGQNGADGFFLGQREIRRAVAYARVYAHRNERHSQAPRTDFAETVYWNALLETSIDGTARVEFDLSDRVTTWSVVVDAHGASRVGQGTGSFEAVTPFRMEAKLPVALTQGDQVSLPIALVSGSERIDQAQLVAQVQGPVDLADPGDQAGALQLGEPVTVPLENGRGRYLVPFVTTGPGPISLALRGSAGGWSDGVGVTFDVLPRGFPQHVSRSGMLTDAAEFTVALPDDYVAGSLEVGCKLYPSPLADLLGGLDGLLQEPRGCFEQASSANYPNLLALSYLEAAGADAPAATARARELLVKGYDKIVGYECSERGYEWFGGDPGHEALSAYGLLEFHDMAAVYDVDLEMVARTRAWLLGRRDGEGGYLQNEKALDSFGRAPQAITNAYVTYALAVTGEEPANLEAELDALEARALEGDDPYEIALAASALQAAGRGAPADAARERLKELQEEDGSLLGTTSSITRSGGQDLTVETTSFAILAWLEDSEDLAHVQRAVEFLMTTRDGRGRFGATQATIQALRALTAYARESRRVANSGEVRLFVNDYPVETIAFESGRKDGIVFASLAEALRPGENRVRIELTGENEFPWSFEARYTAEQPANDPGATVGITTSLARARVAEGETVSMTARIENLTDEGQPMTLAVIGLPAGLEAPTKVLEDLLEAERFDLWEVRERELVLYWRDLAPREVKEVTVDLVARIPGTTTGPASQAYLYYTPQAKRWSESLAVRVE